MFFVTGADQSVHLCSLVGTPVPKGISNSSDNVIVERTPTLVRKVTVLKRLPEHHPVPSRERSVVVKSTKLFPGSHSGSQHAVLSGNNTGGKKHAKELILKTDSMYTILIVLTSNIHKEQNVTVNYQSFIYQLMHKRVALKEY
jgi:hypothetical protein